MEDKKVPAWLQPEEPPKANKQELNVLLERLRKLDEEYLPADVELCDDMETVQFKNDELQKMKDNGIPLPARRVFWKKMQDAKGIVKRFELTLKERNRWRKMHEDKNKLILDLKGEIDALNTFIDIKKFEIKELKDQLRKEQERWQKERNLRNEDVNRERVDQCRTILSAQDRFLHAVQEGMQVIQDQNTIIDQTVADALQINVQLMQALQKIAPWVLKYKLSEEDEEARDVIRQAVTLNTNAWQVMHELSSRMKLDRIGTCCICLQPQYVNAWMRVGCSNGHAFCVSCAHKWTNKTVGEPNYPEHWDGAKFEPGTKCMITCENCTGPVQLPYKSEKMSYHEYFIICDTASVRCPKCREVVRDWRLPEEWQNIHPDKNIHYSNRFEVLPQ